jgi:hypothetical protein
MAEVPPIPEAKPRTPRWVKVMALAAIAIAVLLVVVMKLSGGQHGPARHLPGGGGSSPGVVEDGGGHRPPPGVDHGG